MNQALYHNLIDAKCSQELSKRCYELSEHGQTGQMLILLRGHRKELLHQIHEQQKALDCLDYLIFQTERGVI